MGMVEEVGTYLLSQINWLVDPTVDSTNGNIFYTEEPISPDRALSLYQNAGSRPQYTFGPTLAWVNPRLKVIARNTVIEGAFADAKTVYDTLKLVAGVTFSGTRYMSIQPAGEPEEFGPDPNNRQRVVVYFNVMKGES